MDQITENIWTGVFRSRQAKLWVSHLHGGHDIHRDRDIQRRRLGI